MNYSIKVYYLSYDDSKSLVADIFNVDQGVLLKILDVYGNASFEIHIVGIKELHCDCTDKEIAKSFIDDVESVKDLLPKN